MTNQAKSWRRTNDADVPAETRPRVLVVRECPRCRRPVGPIPATDLDLSAREKEGPMMSQFDVQCYPLTNRQRLWAAYAVREVIALRRIGGRPIPAEIMALDRDLRYASSVSGSGWGRTLKKWDPDDLIGPEDAAAILGCTARYVRQIASDLDGRLVGAVWVFNRRNVLEYAEAKGVA